MERTGKRRRALSEPARRSVPAWLLWAVFGGVTVVLLRAVELPGFPRIALLMLCTGSGALFTALVWFFLLGAQRSSTWAIALLVPYVNLIAASYYARWYWSEDGRPPALLALAGLGLQLLAAGALLSPPLPALV